MYARISIAMLLLAAVSTSIGCHLPSAGLGLPVANNLPPAERILGPGPGVDGPGPAVMAPMFNPAPNPQPAPTVQVLFAKPEGMQIRWDVTALGKFDSEPLIVPGRHNFPQGGIYRLKLTNIEGREGAELYPSLEVGATTPRTAAYLAHSAIPIQFTEEDFDQVLTGNFVTKVVYLPDPEFQELALAGVETLVSTRLDPGIDPIVEADRRGAILAIIRMGNKDEQMPEGNGAGAAPAAFSVAANPMMMGAPMMAGAPMMGGMNGPMINGATMGGPMGMPHLPLNPHGQLPNYVSGVTAPSWGMPMTGTPIGLPGPPHLPLGSPAGLQKHTIRNHTQHHIPGPTPKISIDVKQVPGLAYPAPPNKMYIQEETRHPTHINRQPPSNMSIGAGGLRRAFGH